MREGRVKYLLLAYFLSPFTFTFIALILWSESMGGAWGLALVFLLAAIFAGLTAAMLSSYYKMTGKLTWPVKAYCELSFEEKLRLLKITYLFLMFLGMSLAWIAAALVTGGFFVAAVPATCEVKLCGWNLGAEAANLKTKRHAVRALRQKKGRRTGKIGRIQPSEEDATQAHASCGGPNSHRIFDFFVIEGNRPGNSPLTELSRKLEKGNMG